MKVKINKVISYSLNNKNIKGEPFTVGTEQYVVSPNKLQEKNYTGFPISLQFICTLPDPTLEYEYLKINVAAENADYRQMISKQSQKFDNIKKAQNKRQFVFTFLPPFKGTYNLKLQYFYRPRYFVNTTQQPEQKRDSMTALIKCQQPFEITQTVINQFKSSSIAFPLLVQHGIQSKYPDGQLQFDIQFKSEKFQFKYIHEKNSFKLKNNQIYYAVTEISPKKFSQFVEQKQFNVGSYYIQYGNNGRSQRKVILKQTDKYLIFKGETLVKNIPKKDIVDVPIRFSKLYNANFDLNDVSIVINESLMQGVKVVKISKNKINLDQKQFQELTMSIICLKSGFYQLNGIKLVSKLERNVNFENDLTLFVQNQLMEKAQIFQNTSVVTLPLTEELL